MCGRFTLTASEVDEVARSLSAEVDRAEALLYRPRWNVAPTEAHFIVELECGRRVMRRARFGFCGRGGKTVVNARSESAATLPLFRRAFGERRCLIPADGFYEWQGGRAERRPLFFSRTGGGLLLFAGLAEGEGDHLAFVILTTPANALLGAVHDRMPALLSPDGAKAWLARGEKSLLAPAPEEWLTCREASPRVNRVGNDGPELLAPPPRQQLRLL
ncbi:MAG TPA: SOS response-associated peptidase [Anaeromyxobacteraceae bacterium]|nr:SOS response-associated peptidase [Anaeromyxobacteraceae bacterium]